MKDTVALKILNDEECRDYVVKIISLSLNLDEEMVRKNLKLIHPNIANSNKYKNQVTDVLLENDEMIIDIEGNYNQYESGKIKNTLYLGNLQVRQIKSRDKYQQINLNNFDYYKKGNFLYHSYMMEENSHKKRNDLLEIVDINLEYLSDISYNEIKKLDEKDLRWLLYIFVCKDKDLREQLYQEKRVMGIVSKKLEEVTQYLDELLFYDPDQLREEGMKNHYRKEGRKEEKIEVVKNLLKKDMDLIFIQEVTNMKKEKIIKIKEELAKK